MLSLFSKTRNLQSGFTLAEMVTVVAIIVIMTGIVLANFPDFRNRSSLELVAQEVALVIREAQVFGTNTRGASFGALQFPSYGVYFNRVATLPLSSANSFRLFADRDPEPPLGANAEPNGRFDDSDATVCATVDSECREVYNLTGGTTLTSLETCTAAGVCTDISTGNHALNIVFNRPNPEAQFADESGQDLCSGTCSYAKITLTSPQTPTSQCVYVWTTGHIYVKPTCP